MNYLRAISLFLRIVWRAIEPASTGIPEQYRMRGRVSVLAAWRVARSVWVDQ